MNRHYGTGLVQLLQKLEDEAPGSTHISVEANDPADQDEVTWLNLYLSGKSTGQLLQETIDNAVVAEREACAELIRSWANGDPKYKDCDVVLNRMAEAILARGE